MAKPALPPGRWGLALLAFAPVSGCGRGAADLPPGPEAARPPAADFGQVFEGQLLEHEWELRVGAPVTVSDVTTDCGCTVARLERAGPSGREPYATGTALAAGERLFVGVRYDTRGRIGPAERALTLTADPGGRLRLVLAADVQPWLSVEPPRFEHARLLEGAGAERAFEVRSRSGKPFRLSATGRALAPWVAVELAPRDPDAEGRAPLWAGRVRIGHDAPRGTFSYPIELETDVPIPGRPAGGEARHHSATPAWTIQVVGPVALSRPSLEFGVVRAEETVAQSVLLESFEPGFVPAAVAARLEPVKADEPFPLGRTAAVHTRLVGSACEIEVTLAGLDPEVSGTFLARLVVETGHPALPRLEALVRGVRSPPGFAR